MPANPVRKLQILLGLAGVAEAARTKLWIKLQFLE